MAQLKNTTIQGSARITDTLYSEKIQTPIINAPTSAGGTSYGPGTNGQILTSNGSSAYWAAAPASGVTTITTTSGAHTALTNVTGAVTMNIPTKTSQLTNDAGFITSNDVPEGASAYTGTISAVSTTASNGTNNGFARGDHTHNITKATIDSVLGTGSGTTKFYREDGTWQTVSLTDTKVTQNAAINTNGNYPLLLSKSANTTAETDTVNKQESLIYNPNLKILNIIGSGYETQLSSDQISSNVKNVIEGEQGTLKLLASDSNHSGHYRTKLQFAQYDSVYSTLELNSAYATLEIDGHETDPGSYVCAYTDKAKIGLQDDSGSSIEIGSTLKISDGINGVGSSGQVLTSDGTKSYWKNTTGGNAKIFYGTCSTAAGTATKAVTCADFTSADLVKGAMVYVTFTYTNTYSTLSSLKLNVNSTGDKPLKWLKNAGVTTIPGASYLVANETLLFIYDGTNWVTTDIIYDTNTLLRTYAYSANVELPLLVSSKSTTATAPTHTSSYADLYGGFPATTANRPTINTSTGKLTVPKGISTPWIYTEQIEPPASLSNPVYLQFVSTDSWGGSDKKGFSIYSEAQDGNGGIYSNEISVFEDSINIRGFDTVGDGPEISLNKNGLKIDDGTANGIGTNGQVLMSNGTKAYWGTVSTGSGTLTSVTASGTAPLTLTATPSGSVISITGSVADASETATGVVNTTTQHFKGRKGFNYLSLYAKNDSGTATAYSGDIFYYNGAGTQVAESWYSIGDATNITTGKFTWRQYSPNSTPNTSTSGYYETYQLPATKAGLSANKTYDILTCNGLNNVIPDNSDLNTYTYANNKLGVYNVPTLSNATTITNTPTTATGYTLYSFSGHYSARGHQVAWGAQNTPWLRLESGTAGTWNDWQKLVSINATGSNVGSASKPVYVTSAGLVTACDTSLTDYVKKSGDTMSGNLIVSKAASPEVIVQDTGNNNLKASLCIGSGHQNHGLYSYGYAPSASTYTTSGKWILYRGSDSHAHSDLKIYGAVYNDYAEYREVKENNQPGRCVVETGDGDLVLSTKRLQRGCEIISDTFGFAIGQSEKSNTPIATTGRVLAYLLEDKEYAKEHIGWPVCSGPNGTVSIMTEEEEEKYPSRIIGTISEIPDYEEWGTDNVKIDGRIWIRVR